MPLLTAVALTACAPSLMRSDVNGRSGAPVSGTAPAAARATPGAQSGMASWYGPGFAGRRTANGEVFDPSQLTAAHRELPFNTLVKVTNETNGRSVVVRINDRGPFKGGRIIDLSRASAEAIGMVGSGVARVKLEVLTLPPGAVRIGASGGLRGFEVMSRNHAVGTLLAIRPLGGGDPVVVRVVAGEIPIESPADLMVGYELYAAVGSEAAISGD